MEYKRIAIDTSKAVFTVHGIDVHDRPVLRRNLKRAEFEALFAKLASTEVALEACGSSHHWARFLAQHGHQVRLISRPNTSSRSSSAARTTAPTRRPFARPPADPACISFL